MMESNAPTNGAPPDVADPMLGRVLNERFRIMETLGAGGMGRVYKAMQSPLDRLVALKVLNPQYGEGKDPGFQKRFFLEASVTAKLRHPNTVTVIDYGKTDDGIYYIAMEYLEGLTLGQLLTQMGPLPWPRALNITQQIARSLREAHKVGLIHRDLKPANVMVLNQETDHDIVKVLDFGLVKSFTGDAAPVPQDTSLTQAGIILGSPQYMAPEQARNFADPRSDVYSMGVVLYQMLLGRPPFLASQSIDVIVKHINEPPPAFGSLYPGHGIPAEVEALVMKCLAKAPADRYQSMDAVLDAMRRTMSTVGVSGAFSGARFGAGNVGGSGPISGPHGSGPHGAQGSGPATVALDISVEEAPPKRGPRTLALVLGGASALVGIGAAITLAIRPSEPPTPAISPLAPTLAQREPAAAQAQEPAAQRPPEQGLADEELDLAPLEILAPAPVRFLIVSEPLGARVTYEGKDLGETPLNLEVAPDESGVAQAALTFTMEGYQRTRSVARGAGPEERFTQKLVPKKKTSTRPGKGPDSSAYKDDPY
ncbi:serine/threonine-protein kinase [Comamonas sp. JC664]|uniref:serine/threonine-protein kinase n=1 Tax=Comamonas sp. JC664 TaxID=2801917 RepID=UPI00174B4347|nr:serine/threonine-protein kinase [Comamonas sp. JC664]MBL0696223.1 serine/threonine protein kinase [Comamonas sp. JC664]